MGEQKGQEGKRPGTKWDAYRGEIGAWGGPEVDRFWEDSNCLDSSRYFVDLHRMRTCWEERVRGRGSACSCLPVSRACPCLFAHFLCFPTHYVWGREQGVVWVFFHVMSLVVGGGLLAPRNLNCLACLKSVGDQLGVARDVNPAISVVRVTIHDTA